MTSLEFHAIRGQSTFCWTSSFSELCISRTASTSANGICHVHSEPRGTGELWFLQYLIHHSVLVFASKSNHFFGNYNLSPLPYTEELRLMNRLYKVQSKLELYPSNSVPSTTSTTRCSLGGKVSINFSPASVAGKDRSCFPLRLEDTAAMIPAISRCARCGRVSTAQDRSRATAERKQSKRRSAFICRPPGALSKFCQPE
jgi:hypothetical protein